MALDIESLIEPLSEEEPSGPDLSYDDERITIEGVFERPAAGGGDDDEDDATDWRSTISMIESQMERTRDLWLPVYLMRAGARSGRFDSVVEGAELLARLCEERWPDVHPQLDEYGFIGRKTPCESLTRIGDFLGPLSRVTLIEHPRFGRFGGADFVAVSENGSDAPNYGPFRATIEATPTEDLEALVDKIDALRGSLKRVDSVMTANAEGDTATNLDPTYVAIDALRKAVTAYIPGQECEAAGASSDDAGSDGYSGSGGGGGGAGPSISGAVRSRTDVAKALDAIIHYYEQAEPASPVPFVLRRAKAWISLDFMAVLNDIAPGGLEDATRVLKGRDEEQSSDSWE